jgi:phage tail sheath gpL-like
MPTGVPLSITVPFVGVEFDPSKAQASPAQMPFNVVLAGQKTSTGTGTAGVMYRVYNENEVIDLAGVDSMLRVMARRFWQNNSISDVFIVPLADADGSTKATRVLTIAGTAATEGGTLALMINGKRLEISVSEDDTPTVVGDAVVDKVAEYDYLNWVPVNVTGTVTFTCANAGVAAGDNDMRVSPDPGDKVPAGLTASFASTTPGTVDPDVQDVVDAIGDNWVHLMVNPYATDTAMDILESWFGDNAGPLKQRDGICYQAFRDTVANLITYATGANRNSPYMVLIDAGNRKVSTYELAAMVGGQTAASVIDDPAVPLHRLNLQGVSANDLSERRTLLEGNSLSQNGVATLTDDNGVQTQGTVTMYLRNSAGALDTAYKFQNTIYILQRARFRFVQRILSKYPRAKLMESADRVEAGQQIITPALGKAEAVDWFQEQERQGQFQNLEQFKDQVICRISSSNPNRLEWLLPPELVKQFIVGSAILQFT